jgi:hypothetical protein
MTSDGYGSYPRDIQESPVFKSVGRLAYRFYLLFQHHTTFACAGMPNHDLFPAPAGFSWIKRAGPSILLLALDNRSSRTENVVISEECWAAIWQALEASIDGYVKHLIVVASVPVLYPRMAVVHTALDGIAALTTGFRDFYRSTFANDQQFLVCSIFAFTVLSCNNWLLVTITARCWPWWFDEAYFGHLRSTWYLCFARIILILLSIQWTIDLRDDLLDEWTHPNHVSLPALLPIFRDLNKGHVFIIIDGRT